jgi:hypothetical protein
VVTAAEGQAASSELAPDGPAPLAAVALIQLNHVEIRGIQDAPDQQRKGGGAMPILKTKLYFAGENTVEVYREVTPDGRKMMQYWVPIIKDGVACQVKPEPLVAGQDHWADWERLLRKASKKLAAARRNHSPSLHKITEWPVRKDAVTFFVGGDGAAAGEEIKKILRFHQE